LTKTISLLIPAHNEEESIRTVISGNHKVLEDLYLASRIEDYEIVILNDGSIDKTDAEINVACKELDKIRVMTNTSSTGIEKAFSKLYMEAKFDWVLLTPGDGQWPPSSTYECINLFLKNGAQCGVIGYRANKRNVYGWPRRILSAIFSSIANILTLSYHSDPGSIKLIPKKVQDIKFYCTGVVVEIERIILTEWMTGFKCLKIEVEWNSRIAGKATGANWRSLRQSAIDLPKLILNYVFMRLWTKRKFHKKQKRI